MRSPSLIAISLLTLAAPAFGQIATDGTLGVPAAPFSSPTPEIRIPSTAGKLSGDSLFFSFSDFSVPADKSVVFEKAPGVGLIDTVVARVTGGRPSRIDGGFRSTLGEDHFYFLNPWGVFFGSGSSLSVGGSFHVSTADEVRDSGATFSARNPGETILSGRPEAFGFLSTSDRGDIQVRGVMDVAPGSTLDLIGGDIRIQDGARLWAPGGDIRLVSMADAGDVLDRGAGSALEVPSSGRLGSIEVVGESFVTASIFKEKLSEDDNEPVSLVGEGNDLWKPLVESGLFFVVPRNDVRVGDVEIGTSGDQSLVAILRGPSTGRIAVRSDSLLIENSDLRATSYGADPGSIEIDVDGLFEIRERGSESDVGVFARSESKTVEHPVGWYADPASGQLIAIPLLSYSHDVAASGAGGFIRVDAGDIRILDGGRISASTISSGQGGALQIHADRSILLSGFDANAKPNDSDGNEPRQPPTALFSNSQGAGDGGSIHVETGLLRLERGGAIIAQTTGDGDAGQIEIDVDRLEIVGTSQIDSSTSGTSLDDDEPGPTTGDGGNIDVFARDSILMSGGVDDRQFARISTFSQEKSAGRAGSIRVETPKLEIEDGAGISVTTRGAGDGGDIDVEVGELSLRDRGRISARSNASALAGTITVAADRKVMLDRSAEITASTRLGEGGDISVGAGDAIVMRDASAIVAEAAEEGGSGGRINVASPVFVRSTDSVVSAYAPGGPEFQGEVVIDSPEVNIESRVRPVEAVFQDPATLVRPSCAARVEGDLGGSFAVAPADADRAFARDDLRSIQGPAPGRSDVSSLVELARRARAALESENLPDATRMLVEAGDRLEELPRTSERIVLALHLATSHERFAEHSVGDQSRHLIAAHALFTSADAIAREQKDEPLQSIARTGLAHLYRLEARYDEAALLAREAIGIAERANAPDALYRAHWVAGRIAWDRGDSSDALGSFQRATSVLESFRPEARSADSDALVRFRERVAPVYLDLVTALIESSDRVESAASRQRLLASARTTMEQFRASELRSYFRDECAAEVRSRTVALEDVSARAAVIYPIVLPDRLELLVSLPTGLERVRVPVQSAEVEGQARELAILLQDRTRRAFLRPARRLYDWLVAPYADRLERLGIETLVFVPDGALRLVPMGTLHDGTDFLVNRYAVAVSPGLSLVAPGQLEQGGERLLLAGVSDAVQGFPALPGVATEVAAIQRLFDGSVLLDGDFVTKRFEQSLADQVPSMVHIASHAVFSGDAGSSFVLTHDGRLTMDAIARAVKPTQYRQRSIDLLTFSACETAAGDEQAALGLAGVAIRAGARSALGSLWQVNDEATTALVVGFYRALHESGTAKAQALRRAQQALIADPAFSHPYYWGGFMLINDWS